MQVRATDTGYYGGKRRDPGEEFSLASAGDFSSTWMAAIGRTPGAGPLDHDGDGTKGGVKNTETGLAGMTVAQLRDLAAEKNIDLGDATKKSDIIAAIELAGEADGAGGDHDGDGDADNDI